MTHIVVVGDVMLDRTWTGLMRHNPEAPSPCLQITQEWLALGGAGNVAANVRAAGIPVTLWAIVGEDGEAKIVKWLCEQEGIAARLIRSGQTTVKLRIVGPADTQLIRVDRDGDHGEASHQLDVPPEGDALILSDYGKGVLARDLTVRRMLHRYADQVIVVDPKHGDYSRYQGATVLTPNEAEFAAAGGEGEGWKKWGVGAVLVTCGAAGMVLYRPNHEPLAIPGESVAAVDVCGAGDTVTAWLAAGLVDGLSLEDAARQASRAASRAVMRHGTVAVGRGDMVPEEAA